MRKKLFIYSFYIKKDNVLLSIAWFKQDEYID